MQPVIINTNFWHLDADLLDEGHEKPYESRFKSFLANYAEKRLDDACEKESE